MAASLLALYSDRVGFYIAIDLLAAAVVMSAPSSGWQRMIGLCFVVMGFASIGTAFGQIRGDFVGYSLLAENFFILVGWVQLVLLFCWGSYDVYIFGRYRSASSHDLRDNAHRTEFG